MPNIPNLYFKSFIKDLLLMGSYQDHAQILNIISNSYHSIPIIISIIEEKFDSQSTGDFRFVTAGLRVMSLFDRKNARAPELPDNYLEILNRGLEHRTVTVKRVSLHSIISILIMLYLEYSTSGAQYILSKMNGVRSIIDMKKLREHLDIDILINSSIGERIYTTVGFRWELGDPDFNRDQILTVLHSFWPDF